MKKTAVQELRNDKMAISYMKNGGHFRYLEIGFDQKYYIIITEDGSVFQTNIKHENEVMLIMKEENVVSFKEIIDNALQFGEIIYRDGE